MGNRISIWIYQRSSVCWKHYEPHSLSFMGALPVHSSVVPWICLHDTSGIKRGSLNSRQATELNFRFIFHHGAYFLEAPPQTHSRWAKESKKARIIHPRLTSQLPWYLLISLLILGICISRFGMCNFKLHFLGLRIWKLNGIDMSYFNVNIYQNFWLFWNCSAVQWEWWVSSKLSYRNFVSTQQCGVEVDWIKWI